MQIVINKIYFITVLEHPWGWMKYDPSLNWYIPQKKFFFSVKKYDWCIDFFSLSRFYETILKHWNNHPALNKWSNTLPCVSIDTWICCCCWSNDVWKKKIFCRLLACKSLVINWMFSRFSFCSLSFQTFYSCLTDHVYRIFLWFVFSWIYIKIFFC